MAGVTGAGAAEERIRRAVTLVEVGPRDGLQSEAVTLSVSDRVELILRLIAAGAPRIEVASFVNPSVVPQMAGAEDVLTELGSAPPGASFIGLVLNQRGLERALSVPVDEINLVVAAADGYNRSNQGVSARETLTAVEAMIPQVKQEGRRVTLTISVAFGDPYDGAVAPEHVAEIARSATDAGVDELALGDTIGVAVPSDVDRLVTVLRVAAPEVPLRFHFHNTRNTGLANLYAALGAGVSIFDTSVGGIGGSPFAPGAGGNVATEDAVFFLNRLAITHGIDLAATVETGTWLGDRLGHRLPAALQRAPLWP